MTSFSRTYSKMAGKKNFRIISDSYGDVFLQTDFEAWYELNKDFVQKFRNSYIITEPARFKSIVSEINYLNSSFESGYLSNFNNYTLMDIGSEITIGVGRNTRYLVFRLVTLPSIYPDQADARGYIVTENNTVTVNHPRLKVAVFCS
jgi:hypothetical protein